MLRYWRSAMRASDSQSGSLEGELVRETQSVRSIVQDMHRLTHKPLKCLDEAAAVFAAPCFEFPFVGASPAFEELTGYSEEALSGTAITFLQDGVPRVAVSRSVSKDLQSFCNTCNQTDLYKLPEITLVHAICRKDATCCVCIFMYGLVRLRGTPVILCLAKCVGEGLFARLSSKMTSEASEVHRSNFQRFSLLLQREVACDAGVPPQLSELPRRLSSGGYPVEAHGTPALPLAPQPDDPGAASVGVRSTSEVHDTLPLAPQPGDQDVFGGLSASEVPEFRFFSERLQAHTILCDQGFRALRREAKELANGCLCFSDTPVRASPFGFSFTVRVEATVSAFQGMPVLGFTKRRPEDIAGLHPAVVRCLGSSVLIGGVGQGYARDKPEHFVMGFKTPPQSEIQTFSEEQGKEKLQVKAGDLVSVLYTHDGRMQFFKNGETLWDFDVGRPIDPDASYYAVIDVCYSVASVALVQDEVRKEGSTACATEACSLSCESLTSVPTVVTDPVRVDNVSPCRRLLPLRTCPPSFLGAPEADKAKRDPAESEPAAPLDSHLPPSQAMEYVPESMEPKVPHVVTNACMDRVITAAVAECQFMVTIADPREKDCPLIGISEAFEKISGFARHEIIGQNCRFLNRDCVMDVDQLGLLRETLVSGKQFTGVIPNRRKSGELFMNLLDLRGLKVAYDPSKKEDVWFLVGIQADVTDLGKEKTPKDHLKELHYVADRIRAHIPSELCHAAVAARTCKAGDESSANLVATLEKARGTRPEVSWQLLDQPQWI